MKWKEVTEDRYDEMLGCVPPAIMTGLGFLVGEAWDHGFDGRPRYQAFATFGGKFFEAERPMTVAQFKALLRDSIKVAQTA